MPVTHTGVEAALAGGGPDAARHFVAENPTAINDRDSSSGETFLHRILNMTAVPIVDGGMLGDPNDADELHRFKADDGDGEKADQRMRRRVVPALELAIELGADLNLRDQRHSTPLQLAIMNAHSVEVFKLLLRGRLVLEGGDAEDGKRSVEGASARLRRVGGADPRRNSWSGNALISLCSGLYGAVDAVGAQMDRTDEDAAELLFSPEEGFPAAAGRPLLPFLRCVTNFGEGCEPHPLRLYAYNGSHFCDACGCDGSGFSFHCDECISDVCLRCAVNGTVLRMGCPSVGTAEGDESTNTVVMGTECAHTLFISKRLGATRGRSSSGWGERFSCATEGCGAIRMRLQNAYQCTGCPEKVFCISCVLAHQERKKGSGCCSKVLQLATFPSSTEYLPPSSSPQPYREDGYYHWAPTFETMCMQQLSMDEEADRSTLRTIAAIMRLFLAGAGDIAEEREGVARALGGGALAAATAEEVRPLLPATLTVPLLSREQGGATVLHRLASYLDARVVRYLLCAAVCGGRSAAGNDCTHPSVSNVEEEYGAVSMAEEGEVGVALTVTPDTVAAAEHASIQLRSLFDARDRAGSTALHTAILRGASGPALGTIAMLLEGVQIALAAGPAICGDRSGGGGEAASCGNLTSSSSSSSACVVAADVNAVDLHGQTPLHLCSHFGDFGNASAERAALLLCHGADVNAVDCLGNTALHAIVHDVAGEVAFPTLATVISCGADVCVVNTEGDTAAAIPDSAQGRYRSWREPERALLWWQDGIGTDDSFSDVSSSANYSDEDGTDQMEGDGEWDDYDDEEDTYGEDDSDTEYGSEVDPEYTVWAL